MPSIALMLLTAAPLFANAERALQLLPSSKGITSAECGRCHLEQLTDWSRSRHSASAINRLFVVAWKKEPMRWCIDCHGPVSTQRDEGVGCAACHLREGVVLAGKPPTDRGQRAHPMRLEPRLRQSEFCGECHQFNFPIGRKDPVQYGPHPMQNTLTELRASGEVKSCQGCHSPHRPEGAHDVEALRAAVKLEARVKANDEVRITLRGVGVAHALPTGDPFRRFRVDLCNDAGCRPAVASVEFGRRLVETGPSWELTDDRTVPAFGERTLEVSAPGATRWRLWFAYAARGTQSELLPEEREVQLAEGEITGP